MATKVLISEKQPERVIEILAASARAVAPELEAEIAAPEILTHEQAMERWAHATAFPPSGFVHERGAR